MVLLPFGRMSFMLKKNVALELPYDRIRKVEVREDMLNYRIELDTEDGLISLSRAAKRTERVPYLRHAVCGYERFRIRNPGC